MEQRQAIFRLSVCRDMRVLKMCDTTRTGVIIDGYCHENNMMLLQPVPGPGLGDGAAPAQHRHLPPHRALHPAEHLQVQCGPIPVAHFHFSIQKSGHLFSLM